MRTPPVFRPARPYRQFVTRLLWHAIPDDDLCTCGLGIFCKNVNPDLCEKKTGRRP